jgi:hypothetical protein
MKYSADKVLLETTRLYYYFLQKTPSMEVNRKNLRNRCKKIFQLKF